MGNRYLNSEGSFVQLYLLQQKDYFKHIFLVIQKYTFTPFLYLDNSVAVNHKNLQVLLTKI